MQLHGGSKVNQGNITWKIRYSGRDWNPGQSKYEAIQRHQSSPF